MGLDMYLTKETYVKNWDHMQPPERHEVIVKKGGEVLTSIKPERVSYVKEQVAYWRKANQIHNWFVKNVQEGEDDCGEYDVSREQLAQLVAACKQVLDTVETVDGEIKEGTTFHGDGRVENHTRIGPVVAQKAIAESVLPTVPGFFFGSTDYDEYYIRDLQDTVTQLEPLLTEPGDGSFSYHSSW